MMNLKCNHCDGDVGESDKICPNCGIPLPPNLATQRQRKFLIFFVIVVVFCLFMMVWLPPDWS